MAIDFDNPFTPVVGKVPLHIAGRETIIADVETALSGTGNDPAIISLLVGPRGMGKTALLSYFADTAESSGWITARVTCVEGMLDDILIRTQRAARHLVDTNPSRTINTSWSASQKRGIYRIAAPSKLESKEERSYSPKRN